MKLGETLPRALPASEEVRAAVAAEWDLRASGRRAEPFRQWRPVCVLSKLPPALGGPSHGPFDPLPL